MAAGFQKIQKAGSQNTTEVLTPKAYHTIRHISTILDKQSFQSCKWSLFFLF